MEAQITTSGSGALSINLRQPAQRIMETMATTEQLPNAAAEGTEREQGGGNNKMRLRCLDGLWMMDTNMMKT